MLQSYTLSQKNFDNWHIMRTEQSQLTKLSSSFEMVIFFNSHRMGLKYFLKNNMKKQSTLKECFNCTLGKTKIEFYKSKCWKTNLK